MVPGLRRGYSLRETENLEYCKSDAPHGHAALSAPDFQFFNRFRQPRSTPQLSHGVAGNVPDVSGSWATGVANISNR